MFLTHTPSLSSSLRWWGAGPHSQSGWRPWGGSPSSPPKPPPRPADPVPPLAVPNTEPDRAPSTPSPSATTWTAPKVSDLQRGLVGLDARRRAHQEGLSRLTGLLTATIQRQPRLLRFRPSEAEERFYTLRGVGDDIQSKAALKSQQTIFSNYQTTQRAEPRGGRPGRQ